ncbi:RimJ/RimL family protein N-acetyltransferase [Nocardiopsis sp. Huas11]|uniref:GNAT family N-acetyltransferase n=1 Tax=Nocardiopsis sp. Huas11 TaxID=2183912 RepID=UPI000EAC6262|nr:GNAT family protein [Nocardiopsis sp. Huas11]RKS06910.1 RimJ/RimL family protein N-acetyltransferase [Nocardiopsis sp. Huas11]
MISEHFPPMGLRVRTPRLELRLPSMEDLAALGDVAAAGIHTPEQMPFSEPWTDQPPAKVALSVIQYNLGKLAAWTPADWNMNLVVVHEGAVAGVQDVGAKDFAVRREVGTGSWLGRSFQGRGIGTEMRAAVLHLAFEGLGALSALSTAFEGNEASAAVSRRLGYRPNGVDTVAVRGKAVQGLHYRLTRQDWERHRTVPVTVSGLEPCLPFFGLGLTEED